MRRTAGKEVPIFTKGSSYDVLVVADEAGEFGEYLAYRTWDLDRLLERKDWFQVHGTEHTSNGVQHKMQNRFRRESGRWMTEVDYHAWTAVRALGESITKSNSNKTRYTRISVKQ